MPMNAKKLLVQCLPHKRTSKSSTSYSLAARTNVSPHQYDGELIFLWSTDFRWIAFACSPNIYRISEWRRMLFAYKSTLCVSRAFSHLFCVCVQMWTQLNAAEVFAHRVPPPNPWTFFFIGHICWYSRCAEVSFKNFFFLPPGFLAFFAGVGVFVAFLVPFFAKSGTQPFFL